MIIQGRGREGHQNGKPIELVPDSEGRLWSEELECYLVEDGYYLAFVDENGQRYLTARQAEEVARQVEQAARQQVEAALEAETLARQQAELRAQTQEAARQALEQQVAELLKKLEGKE